MEFRRININSKEGLKEAEKLQAKGWVICGAGFEMVTFSKGKSSKH
jgi:hypothetical protein